MIIAVAGGLAVLMALCSFHYYRSFRRKKQLLRSAFQMLFAERTNRSNWKSVLDSGFARTRYGKRIAADLEKARLSLQPGEFLAFAALSNIVIAWGVNQIFSIPPFPAILFSAVLVDGFRRWFFRMRINRNMELFHKQLPDACRLLANALRAGQNVTQGIEMLSREMPEPARQELQLLHKELMLGVELDMALDQFRKRFLTKECDLFAGAIRIQRKIGGNLPAVLDNLARTMEERAVLKQAIQTLTAEARYVSLLLPAVPIALGGIMNLMIDGFLRPLLTLPGILLVSAFLVVQFAAFLAIKKITDVKV